MGALPQGLPALYLPAQPELSTLNQLLLPTLIITLVSFLETSPALPTSSAPS